MYIVTIHNPHNVDQFWNYRGILYTPLSTDQDQMWHVKADTKYVLICQISSGSVYSVATFLH